MSLAELRPQRSWLKMISTQLAYFTGRNELRSFSHKEKRNGAMEDHDKRPGSNQRENHLYRISRFSPAKGKRHGNTVSLIKTNLEELRNRPDAP
jgi:hypothetical protein